MFHGWILRVSLEFQDQKKEFFFFFVYICILLEQEDQTSSEEPWAVAWSFSWKMARKFEDEIKLRLVDGEYSY